MLEQRGYAMIGQTISHFSIEEQIGAGGMGVVYRARDERLDREVALKVLSPALVHDQSFLERFRREARLLSKLNHPNIATIHDFDTIEGTSFLVMELIQGETLNRKVANGPLPESEIVRLASQLLQGLQAAHDAGIIHRDLKPSNLRETPDGRVKILDFGLARIAQADLETTQSTATAGVVGTLPYMSPEQLRGESVDARTDIYSAGVVLYELAAGQRPFNETLAPRLIDSILHRPATSPREFNPQISPALEHIILKALEKLPQRRYQTAREMLAAVECLTTGSTAQATVAPGSAFTEKSEAPPMEIAHVLFTDIVGYSKLPMDEQQRQLRHLQKLVRETPAFERARSMEQLISLPTGDGMALVFFGEPEMPVRCALELSAKLRSQPEIKLRMGINSGPVYRVADINANRNVAGGGINIAQRVMDCGDAGHILVSKSVADVLSQLSIWQGRLEDLGEVEVKHGVLVHIFNLHTEEGGNPALPEKVQRKRSAVVAASGTRRKAYAMGLAAVVVVGVLSAVVVSRYRRGTENGQSKGQQPAEAGQVAPEVKLRPAIAVLGFKNLTTPEEGWVSGALTEWLNTELAAGDQLRTIAGEDVARLKTDLSLAAMSSYGKETLAKIRKILASDYVVTGSYDAAGNLPSDTVRVDVRLQNSDSGETLSSFSEAGTIGALPDLMKRAGANVRVKLEVPDPTDVQAAQAKAALPSDPEAIRLYSEGLKRLQVFDALGAREFLRQAVEADPKLALAHAALANAWELLGYDENARKEGEEAVKLSADLCPPDQRSIEGRYRELTNDWQKAIDIYQSLSGVYRDEPNYALDLANAQTSAGKGQDALATLQDLRTRPHMNLDPRVDFAEALAYQSLSDAKRQRSAAAQAAKRASEQGSRYLAAQAYWQECSALTALGNLKEAEGVCRKANAAADDTGQKMVKARSMTALSRVLATEGHRQEAMAERESILQTVSEITSKKDMIGALINLAMLQSTEGQLTEAQNNEKRAIEIAREIGDKQQLFDLENNLGADAITQGDFQKGKAFYGDALTTAHEAKDEGNVAVAAENLGSLALAMGDLATAERNVRGGLVVAQQAHLKGTTASAYGNLGDIQMAKGNLKQAQQNYETELQLFNEIGDKANIASTWLSLARLALEKGDAVKSQTLASQALEQFGSENLVDGKGDAENTIADALISQGKIADAQNHLESAATAGVQDYVTKISLACTAAKLKAKAGNATEAASELHSLLGDTNDKKLITLQFDIKLALAESDHTGSEERRAFLLELENDARKSGYLLIAAKAHHLEGNASN